MSEEIQFDENRNMIEPSDSQKEDIQAELVVDAH
jgi:hypothetical protein